MTHHFRTTALAITLGVLLSAAALWANAADTKVRWLTFPKDSELAASVTLLKREGKVGRDNPFYDNYRPQLQFIGAKASVTCAVRIPKPQEKVDPGETAGVKLVCLDDVKAPENDLSFIVLEGGRKVGEGALTR